jgi:hypothetical protein
MEYTYIYSIFTLTYDEVLFLIKDGNSNISDEVGKNTLLHRN